MSILLRAPTQAEIPVENHALTQFRRLEVGIRRSGIRTHERAPRLPSRRVHKHRMTMRPCRLIVRVAPRPIFPSHGSVQLYNERVKISYNDVYSLKEISIQVLCNMLFSFHDHEQPFVVTRLVLEQQFRT